MFYACSYSASYSQILNCVCMCVRVRGFFSFFFIVSMDILSEINFMMMMMMMIPPILPFSLGIASFPYNAPICYTVRDGSP